MMGYGTAAPRVGSYAPGRKTQPRKSLIAARMKPQTKPKGY